VQVERFPTAASFLLVAEPFLLRSEVENTLILGVAHGLVSGSVAAEVPPYFAVVREGAEICVAAFQTLAAKLGVTRALRPDALMPLALDVYATGSAVRSVVGPEPSVGALAAHLAALGNARARRSMAQRIHQLRAVDTGNQLAPGRLRPAHATETDLLATWASDFLQVVGDPADPVEAVRERLTRGQLFVWDHKRPVSMAAWTGKTPTGVRVGFVYTPPARRGHGYATAAVASLSQLLLDQGNRYCCLYTDVANPTSNAIYHRIGYRPVCDAAVYSLAD